MKAKISPTSPKYQIKELEKLYAKEGLKKIDKPPKKLRGELIILIFVSIIFGFLAGLLGKICLDYVVANYPEYTPKFLNANSSSSGNGGEKNSKKIVSSYFDVIQDVEPSQVSIYLEKGANDDPLGQVYLPSEIKGTGIILSNDGLVVTTKGAISDPSGSYIAVTSEKAIYPVKKLLSDPTTGLVFFKIEAKNLKVAQFAAHEDLYLGQGAAVLRHIAGSNQLSFLLTEITDHEYTLLEKPVDLVQSSEKYQVYVQVDHQFGEGYEGSPLITAQGQVIGLFSGQVSEENNLFIPVFQFEGIIKSILSEEEIIRPYLGLRYVNLAQATNISSDLSQDYKRGILIYAGEQGGGLAIEKLSPAEKSGLLEKDIITKIGEEEIDFKTDFTALIQARQVGETLTFTIFRTGTEKKVQVKLEKYNI